MRISVVGGLALVLVGAGCSGGPTGPNVGPTSTAAPQPTASPTPAATTVPVASAPAPTPDPRQAAFGLHSPLPLAGEFAVTANMDDRTLSVVPIGAAAVATTVQLDIAPRAVGAAPNSDTVLAADGSPTGRGLVVASLDASSESGSIDLGSQPEGVASPSPSVASGPLVVISETGNTLRSVDPSTHELSAPVELGQGPHTVSISGGNSMLTPQVFVANSGDGTVTILDGKAASVQSTLRVGGKPVGVARTIDGRLWVANGEDGSVSMFDATSGDRLQTVAVGPKLTALASTPDGRYLVLASGDPDAALYVVDLVSSLIGSDPSATSKPIGGEQSAAVRRLAVPSGVLALATGAEITRAYATTGDGHLLYWDLESNAIDQTIEVGQNPVGLTLGLVEPSGGTSVAPGAGTTAGGAGAGGAAA
ncbi:MAG TPA: hypothetical protein VF937_00570, partial [Chloroflexota bacterium]